MISLIQVFSLRRILIREDGWTVQFSDLSWQFYLLVCFVSFSGLFLDVLMFDFVHVHFLLHLVRYSFSLSYYGLSYLTLFFLLYLLLFPFLPLFSPWFTDTLIRQVIRDTTGHYARLLHTEVMNMRAWVRAAGHVIKNKGNKGKQFPTAVSCLLCHVNED